MRSTLLLATIFTLFASNIVRAQEGAKNDLEVSSAVIKTAEWANFKYMETLDLAQAGNQKALKDFFEFSSVVDGTESLQHATTCLELIPLATDEKFGSVISILKPKLKTVLMDRLVLAQGRTKKEPLQKPLKEWAPLTWKALNGEIVKCSSCNKIDGQLMKKPDGTLGPNAKMQPAETTTDSEKH
jgi:hypothetical protein